MSDYPETVYKYRSWCDENHKRVLTHNELYLSCPEDMNDPFDCRIPTNYKLLDSSDKRNKFANQLVIKWYDFFQRHNIDIERELVRLDYRLENDLDNIQAELSSYRFKLIQDHLGVLSLSGRWDSTLMWSHYSDYHRGYCVGFNEKKIRESNLFGKGGNVHYNKSDEFPTIDPLNTDEVEKAFIETHFKAKDWHYEKEYRLATLKYPQVMAKSDRIVTIPDDFFEEIHLGWKISSPHKKEIIEYAQEKSIKIYQVEPVPGKFKLNRRLI